MKGKKGSVFWKAWLTANLAGCYIQQKRLDSVSVLLDEVLAEAKPANFPHPLYLTLLNHKARIEYERALLNEDRKSSLLAQARHIYETNESMEKQLPPDLRLRVRNNNLGLVLIAEGKFSEAVKKLTEDLEKHSLAKHLFGILVTTLNLATAHRFLKNFDLAVQFANEAVQAAQMTGQGRWLQHAHHEMANIYYDKNLFDKTLAEDNIALAASVFLESPEERSQTLMAIWTQKGHCHREIGEYNRAVVNFEAALAIGSRINIFFELSCREGLGESLFHKGELEKSLRHLEAAEGLIQKLPYSAIEGFVFPVRRLHALALCRLGKKTEAMMILKSINALSQKNIKWRDQFIALKRELELKQKK